MTMEGNKHTFTFHHPQLGQMTGIVRPDNVVQFRAIPYATFPARFKQSVLNESFVEGDGNFTESGFACPQFFPDRISDGGMFPGDVVPPPSDEFKCLILQLNIPLQWLQSQVQAKKLPVLVYIHGGGFVLGKIDEQHSTAPMVEQSILDSQPVISASLQYRLGALGYLYTPEAGNKNLALNDQRNALLWIQRFIDGFGGDRNQVTVFGESAGSMSICAHLLSPPPPSGPLFRRAILMSGMIGPMTAPSTVTEATDRYERFRKTCGVQEQGEEGLQKLRELDVRQIVEASATLGEGGEMWLTVRDEQWFGKDAKSLTWEKVPELIGKCDWVDSIVIGATSFEGTTFMERIAHVSPKDFLDGIEEQLGQESARATAEIYGITPDMDKNLFLTIAMRWIGDVIFDVPNHNLASYLTTHTNKKVYRYIFDVRNPFPNNPLYQQPHHWVDIYFVFRTFHFRYPTQNLRNISTRHAQLWLDFARGKAPWSQYKYTGNGDEIIMVADERDGWIERTVAQDERITELSWKRCEKLLASWERMEGRAFYPLLIAPLKGKKLT